MWRNWSGTVRCRAFSEGVALPRDRYEAEELVRTFNKKGVRVRPVGAGHSWNPAAFCLNPAQPQLFLDTRFLNRLTLDEEGDVRVEPGIKMGQLALALERA